MLSSHIPYAVCTEDEVSLDQLLLSILSGRRFDERRGVVRRPFDDPEGGDPDA